MITTILNSKRFCGGGGQSNSGSMSGSTSNVAPGGCIGMPNLPSIPTGSVGTTFNTGSGSSVSPYVNVSPSTPFVTGGGLSFKFER
jgi:hypothetical protein